MKFPRVSVLLATYNGERYLDDQLQSLFRQDYVDFEIVVSDDGSDDATMAILQRHQRQHPARLRILDASGLAAGARQNFLRLLRISDAPIVAFCDQDDVWYPDKLSSQVRAMERAQTERGMGTPILCCSDARIVDARLETIAESYFEFHGLDPAGQTHASLPRLAFTNMAIGATTVMNRALVSRCLEMPECVVMHDWWAALLAAALGSIEVIERPLILYRQHGANVIGAGVGSSVLSPGSIGKRVAAARSRFVACIDQLRAVHMHVRDHIEDPGLRHVVDRLSELPAVGPLTRVVTLLRCDALRPRFHQNLLHMYLAMTTNLDRAGFGGHGSLRTDSR